MTNADKIRSMNDEQLADWIGDYVDPCSLCSFYKNGCGTTGRGCDDGRLSWLKQEYDESDNDTWSYLQRCDSEKGNSGMEQEGEG